MTNHYTLRCKQNAAEVAAAAAAGPGAATAARNGRAAAADADPVLTSPLGQRGPTWLCAVTDRSSFDRRGRRSDVRVARGAGPGRLGPTSAAVGLLGRAGAESLPLRPRAGL